jgi:hypothetical protein
MFISPDFSSDCTGGVGVLETGGRLSVFSLSFLTGGLSLSVLADDSASDLGLTVGTNAVHQF